MKLIKILITSILALMLTAALSLGSYAKGSKLEVWFWAANNEFASIINDLAAKSFTPKTGISVKAVPYAGNDISQKFLMSYASGDEPDVMSMPPDGLLDLAVRGALYDIKNKFSDDYKQIVSKYPKHILSAMEWNKLGFCVIDNVTPNVTMYRTDILKDLGLPQVDTFDDLYTILPKLQAKKMNFGLNFMGMNSWPEWGAVSLVYQHGGSLYRPNGMSGLDTSQGKAGFKEYVDLFKKHKVEKTINAWNTFRSGEVPIHVGMALEYFALTNFAPEMKGKIGVGLFLGRKTANGKNHSSIGSVRALGISKKSDKVQDAWKFIKWYVSADTQATIANRVLTNMPGYVHLPVDQDVWDRITEIPAGVKKLFVRAIEDTVAVPYTPGGPGTIRFINTAVNEAVVQDKDTEDTLDKAVKEINKEISRKIKEFSRFLKALNIEM